MSAGLRQRARTWAKTSETVERWRRRRYERFVALCALVPDDRILDVGAGGGDALERFNETNPITALDLSPWSSRWLERGNVTVVTGDGTRLPFDDLEFDVVFSNSVIEHVPVDMQTAFAEEVRRVAQRYFIQTPNRWFPIEPHYQFPLFQFFPERFRRFLNRHFTLGFQPKGYWEPIHLLSAEDLRRLFPDAVIHREKVLGLTKSLMAVRSGNGPAEVARTPPPRPSRPGSSSRRATSPSPGRGSWSRWTASSSVVFRARRGRRGSTPPSTPTRPTCGRACM